MKVIDIVLWLVALIIGIIRGIVCGAIYGLLDELEDWWTLVDRDSDG
jgi:hypothetical protein